MVSEVRGEIFRVGAGVKMANQTTTPPCGSSGRGIQCVMFWIGVCSKDRYHPPDGETYATK